MNAEQIRTALGALNAYQQRNTLSTAAGSPGAFAGILAEALQEESGPVSPSGERAESSDAALEAGLAYAAEREAAAAAAMVAAGLADGTAADDAAETGDAGSVEAVAETGAADPAAGTTTDAGGAAPTDAATEAGGTGSAAGEAGGAIADAELEGIDISSEDEIETEQLLAGLMAQQAASAAAIRDSIMSMLPLFLAGMMSGGSSGESGESSMMMMLVMMLAMNALADSLGGSTGGSLNSTGSALGRYLSTGGTTAADGGTANAAILNYLFGGTGSSLAAAGSYALSGLAADSLGVGSSARPGARVTPALTSDTSNRSSSLYRAVIDQFNVELNPRYQPNQRGYGDTYCNIFCWDVTSAMGAEVPYLTDRDTGEPLSEETGNAKRMNANSMCEWLNTYGSRYGWYEVTAEQAQALANQGKPVVTAKSNPTGHGHMQIVSPSEDGLYDPERGVALAQAGGKLRNYTYMRNLYSASYEAQVQYFAHR